MKALITGILLTLASLFTLQANDAGIRGPQGNISYKICLPDGFDPAADRCPMVILMHGIFSSKDYNPMPAIAMGLAKAGVASIRFDFNGHGRSEGRIVDMTVEKEIADALAVCEYVRSLPYVTWIGFLGHSQGGVVASMTAGRLAARGSDIPAKLVLVAPGSIIKEACQNGKFFDARFDPADPPESISCYGFLKLGREYLVTTQELDIFGTAAAYRGPVRIIHGTRDTIVPMWCSECYKTAYAGRAALKVVEGENHTISRRRSEVVRLVVEFFK